MPKQIIEHEIPLGSKVEETITGFKGTVTGVARYLTGCNQYSVVPKMKGQSTEPPEGHWYDEGRLKVLPEEGVAEKDVSADDNGGPVSDAPVCH